MDARPATTEGTKSDRRAGIARRLLVIAGAVFVIYGALGALVAPPIAKRLIASKLGEKLGRVVQVEKVSVNPYTLEASAEGVRILEADGKTPFVSVDRLDMDGSIVSLRLFAPVVNEVNVDGLQVRLVRDGENHYNASDILARLASEPKKKDEEPARFSVSNIRVANSRIDFDDRPVGTKHEVTHLDIAIPFVSNLPRHLKQFVQPRLSADVNGSPLRITGETLPFEEALRTHVALRIEGVDLPRYMGYSPTPLPVKLSAGKLDGRIHVKFTQANAKAPAIDVSGNLAAHGLVVTGPEGELARVGRFEADVASFDPLAGTGLVQAVRVTDAQSGEPVKVAAAEAHGIKIDLRSKEIHVDSVATRGGVLALKRGTDGAIEMPVRVPEGSQAAQPAQPSAPWRVAVAAATIDDYNVSLHDAAVKPAITHRVTLAHVEAKDLGTEKGSKSTVLAKLGVDKAGALDVDASVVLDPLVVEAKVDARRIDLLPLRPYALYFKTVKLKSGLVSAKGHVQLRGDARGMKVAYVGNAEIAKLGTFDTTSNEDLVNWDSVRATGIALRWAREDPLELAVRDIDVAKAYARVVVTPEGKINLQQLKLATDDNPAPEPEPQENLKPRRVRIDRVSFADSRLNFTDHYIRPNYTADVGELGGTVTELSSDPAARGVVDLKGSFDKASPVVIAGTINPLSGDLFLDISAKGKDIDLPRLSAYSMRYAGYPIKDGKLTLDVKYHVEGGKLDGRNKIVLDQLVFGDKVESAEATTLPVLFAVNLLKDANGRIDLELPIKGSLEDPQFDIGALIGQVVGNLLKKALTAPFSLLSAAFGGSGGASGSGAASAGAPGGEDLAFVSFDAGRAEGTDVERAKLERIGKALVNRPAVRIEMAPHVDPEKDMAALKRTALRAKLGEGDYPSLVKVAYEKEFAKEPKEKGAAAPTAEQMEARLLEKVQIEDGALRGLAAQRAEWVRGQLVAQGGLPAERILVASADAGDTGSRVSRVDFTLK